jgi:hypothetical protein
VAAPPSPTGRVSPGAARTAPATRATAGPPSTVPGVDSSSHHRYPEDVSDNDALARKHQADLIVDRAAEQLRLLLREAAQALRPFPPFPGAWFTNAVEVELDGVERPDLGCVVVAEDGELYELEMKLDFSDDVMDMAQARDEKLKELEDLHPRDYVVLAYNALSQLTELLLERADASP